MAKGPGRREEEGPRLSSVYWFWYSARPFPSPLPPPGLRPVSIDTCALGVWVGGWVGGWVDGWVDGWVGVLIRGDGGAPFSLGGRRGGGICVRITCIHAFVRVYVRHAWVVPERLGHLMLEVAHLPVVLPLEPLAGL
jgi:hypothetical protein